MSQPDRDQVEMLLVQLIAQYDDKVAAIEEVRDILHDLSPLKGQPVDRVQWVPAEKVEANDYNPNTVAPQEMTLLAHSIKQDGYTQPVVVIYDKKRDRYVIVDGFHRHYVGKHEAEVKAQIQGYLPVVVIEKDINERMAATVRHNRARGRHSVAGMSSMVFQMLDQGMEDSAICNELGMEAEELLRLKHITGFSKLFEDAEYKKAWETKRMIRLRVEHQKQEQANA